MNFSSDLSHKTTTQSKHINLYKSRMKRVYSCPVLLNRDVWKCLERVREDWDLEISGIWIWNLNPPNNGLKMFRSCSPELEASRLFKPTVELKHDSVLLSIASWISASPHTLKCYFRKDMESPWLNETLF